MGNKKNRNIKSSSYRHVYCKKKGACRKKTAAKGMPHLNPNADGGAENTSMATEGSRIINFGKLQDYFDDLNKHSAECEGSVISLWRK